MAAPDWRVWSLLSAAFAAATAILAKVGVTGVDPNVATAVRTSVVVVFTWVLALTVGRPAELATLPPRTWLFLTLSGLATGLSWVCYFRALQVGDVSKVAPVDKLSVAFAIAFAALFLGERLSLQTVFGGTLIVAGALVLAWS